jgi:hypothetical protein
MKLTKIEHKAEDIDKTIAGIISKAKKDVDDLKVALRKNDFPEKNATVQDLESDFHTILKKTDELYANIDELREAKKDVLVSDQQFLEDKLTQLEKMRSAIHAVLDLLGETPSDEEFEHGALDKLFEEMGRLIEALNLIIGDDKRLLAIYENLK